MVDAALNEGIKVVPIPGVSAMTAAASVAGVSMRRFIFEGFLPKKKGRQTLLKSLVDEKRTIMFFESPHRVVKTLKDIEEFIGVKNIVLVREITKIYEEIIRGTTTELISKLENKTLKGEFVIIVRGNEQEEKREKENKYAKDDEWEDDEE